MQQARARCEEAMTIIADKWEEKSPDIAAIFGNDQHEIYGDDLNTPFMVFYGEKIPWAMQRSN
jgi:hypothetical protein